MLQFGKSLLLTGSLLLHGMVSAADPIPPVKPASPFVSPGSDRLLSLNVTSALSSDPELNHLPIMVDVLNKVAILGGAVPDEETKRKVESVVRKVPGITQVQNGCWIRQNEDPLKQLVFERLDGIPAKVAEAAVPRLPSVLVLPPEPKRTVAEPLAIAKPTPMVPLITRPTDRRPGGSVTVHRVQMNSFPRLEDPTKPSADLSELPMPAVTVNTPIYPMIPPMNLPTKALSPQEEIQRIQQSQARWKQLNFKLSGNRVQLGGRSPHPGDIWDFATAISNVPGVERIIVMSQ
jgi:hypothetical protein